MPPKSHAKGSRAPNHHQGRTQPHATQSSNNNKKNTNNNTHQRNVTRQRTAAAYVSLLQKAVLKGDTELINIIINDPYGPWNGNINKHNARTIVKSFGLPTSNDNPSLSTSAAQLPNFFDYAFDDNVNIGSRAFEVILPPILVALTAYADADTCSDPAPSERYVSAAMYAAAMVLYAKEKASGNANSGVLSNPTSRDTLTIIGGRQEERRYAALDAVPIAHLLSASSNRERYDRDGDSDDSDEGASDEEDGSESPEKDSYIKSLRFLLECGADVDCMPMSQLGVSTPIELCISASLVRSMRVLLEYGCEVGQPIPASFTPLGEDASAHGQCRFHCGKQDCPAPHGLYSPYTVDDYFDREAFANGIESIDSSITPPMATPSRASARRAVLYDRARHALEGDVARIWSPLHLVAQTPTAEHQADIAALLMELGADVDGRAPDNTGDGIRTKMAHSSCGSCCAHSHDNESSSSPYLGGQGRTPLMLLAMSFDGAALDTLFALLAEGADVTLRDVSSLKYTAEDWSEEQNNFLALAIRLWRMRYKDDALSSPKRPFVVDSSVFKQSQKSANKKKGSQVNRHPSRFSTFDIRFSTAGMSLEMKKEWVVQRCLLALDVPMNALQLSYREAAVISAQIAEEKAMQSAAEREMNAFAKATAARVPQTKAKRGSNKKKTRHVDPIVEDSSARASPLTETEAAQLRDEKLKSIQSKIPNLSYHVNCSTPQHRRFFFQLYMSRRRSRRYSELQARDVARGKARHHKETSRIACGCKNCFIDFEVNSCERDDTQYALDLSYFGDYQEVDAQNVLNGRVYGGGGMYGGYGDSDDEYFDEDFGYDDDYGLGGTGYGGDDDMMSYLMRQHPAYFAMTDEDEQERYWKHHMYFDV